MSLILDTGWSNFSTFANDATVGSASWSTPSNAGAEDGTVSSINVGGPATSQYLLATGLVSPPPSGSYIVGIEIRYKCQGQNVGVNCRDNSIRLFKAGVATGTGKSGATWPYKSGLGGPGLSFLEKGSASDLWGATFTSEEVRATGFGVGVSAVWSDFTANTEAEIDVIQCRISYTDDRMIMMF